MSADVYLGLGANLGNPRSNFEKSRVLIEQFCEVLARSKLYLSSPYGYADQPPFFNAALRISTDLSPQDLLHKLQETERVLGKREIRKNGPRIIDLDLLLYDNLFIENEKLTLPHPRILERDFVLLPLLDLNPKLTHPSWGSKSLKSALSELHQKFVRKEPEPWELM